MNLTRVLTLRKIWAQLGRVIGQIPDTEKQLPHNIRAGQIWSNLGRALQRLNAKALAGHLERKKGRLVYKARPGTWGV